MVSSIQISFLLITFIEPILGITLSIQIWAAIIGENIIHSLVILDMRKDLKVENNKEVWKFSHKNGYLNSFYYLSWVHLGNMVRKTVEANLKPPPSYFNVDGNFLSKQC